MTIAVMQPYIFPYIGYFQMIKAVDAFVFYDDVNYIKGGWINRNQIIINNKSTYFTIPLKNSSSFRCINEIEIIKDSKDYKKILKSIEQAYRKAPFFSAVMPIVNKVLNSDQKLISEMSIESIRGVSEYLDLETKFKKSSESYHNRGMERQERLIDICKHESANHYINALGGQELYKKEDFHKGGIRLSFIKSNPIEYKQFNKEFVPWLSIIDVLMFNSKEETLKLLDNYELI